MSNGRRRLQGIPGIIQAPIRLPPSPYHHHHLKPSSHHSRKIPAKPLHPSLKHRRTWTPSTHEMRSCKWSFS